MSRNQEKLSACFDLVVERQQMAICCENGVQYLQKMISRSKPLLFNRKDKRGQGACWYQTILIICNFNRPHLHRFPLMYSHCFGVYKSRSNTSYMLSRHIDSTQHMVFWKAKYSSRWTSYSFGKGSSCSTVKHAIWLMYCWTHRHTSNQIVFSNFCEFNPKGLHECSMVSFIDFFEKSWFVHRDC